MPCATHILTLIVIDDSKDIYEFIIKIRETVIYMKSSPSRFFELQDLYGK